MVLWRMTHADPAFGICRVQRSPLCTVIGGDSGSNGRSRGTGELRAATAGSAAGGDNREGLVVAAARSAAGVLVVSPGVLPGGRGSGPAVAGEPEYGEAVEVHCGRAISNLKVASSTDQMVR